ncbi:MAG: DUF2238 domain-containing protein [bacterium]|nr:DUF2238 domain-containing protein [bacterium]
MQKKTYNRNVINFLIINFIYISVFSIWFYMSGNREFLIYIFVMIALVFTIFFTDKKVEYPNSVFIGFTIWGIIHMMGGGFSFNGTRFYDLILLPVSEKYSILKYDQVAHVVANYLATILMFLIIRGKFQNKIKSWFAISVVVVMAGSGIGAINELIEFLAFLKTGSTGMGGYVNTLLDLFFNLIGGIIAMTYIRLKKGKI